MEENISPNPQSEPVVEMPVQTPKPWLKVGLILFFGLVLAGGLVFAGYKFG